MVDDEAGDGVGALVDMSMVSCIVCGIVVSRRWKRASLG